VLKEGDEEFIPPETPYDPLKDEEASFTPRPDSHFWNDLDLIPKSDPRYDEPPIIPLPY
jgi:hypothetical protein